MTAQRKVADIAATLNRSVKVESKRILFLFIDYG